MQEIPSNTFNGLAFVIPIILIAIAAAVLYFVLLVSAIIGMLRQRAHSVLMTFAFLALVPFPPILIMGIMILIIWHYHKRDILAGETTRS